MENSVNIGTSPSQVKRKASESGASWRDAHILLAGEDGAVLEEAGDVLRNAGFFHVVTASETETLRRVLHAEAPDVIVSSMGADLQRGLKFLEELQNAPTNRSAPVLLLTDGASATAHETALDQGAADFLSLPYDKIDFTNRVRTHIKRHRLQALLDRRTDRLNEALNLLRETEKRLTAELAEVRTENRERIDYFAETHHELRTPLNAICGMSDAMQRQMFGPLGDERYRGYANNIYQAGRHMLGIIDGRLNLSRIEAGAEKLEIDDVDIRSVIAETTEMLGELAGQAKIRFEVDIEPDLPIIETDKRKLRQILVNLVSNAIKYTPENGRVMLNAKKNEQKGVMVLVVSDTGIGMTAENLHEVMRPYKRLPGAAKDEDGGTGLGLPIARKLVELLGGEMEMRSAPNRGTSIKIELPLLAPGHAPPQAATG